MWDKLTVEQYQQIHLLQSRDIDPVEKVVQAIAIAFDMTEAQVNDLPVDEFNRYAKSVAFSLKEAAFVKRARRTIKANGTRYRMLYEVGKLRFGQYVELQSFIRGGVIENLHLIAASISAKTRFFFWAEENESRTHEDRATDFLQANFQQVYLSVVFFCSLLAQFNRKFNPPKEDEDDEEEEPVAPFIQHFGWIYSATKLAEHERIPLDEAYNLNVTQALNDLYYLKEYNDYQMEMNRKAKSQWQTSE